MQKALLDAKQRSRPMVSVPDKLPEGKSIVRSERGVKGPLLLGRIHPGGRGKKKGKFQQEPRRPRLISDKEGEPQLVLEEGELSQSVGIAKSLIDPRTIYRFRLIDFNSFSSSGAGVLAAYISCSPSVTSFSEYSSLTNLFTEVRLVAARLTICNVNPHADGYATGFVKSDVAMNYNDLSVSTTPSSVLAVLDNAHSWLHPLGKSSHSQYVAKVSSNREFADTATPAPGPYAGCTGQFSIYQSALTASTTYIDYFLECEFEFRNRD
jgi:hypothetical protein